MHCKFDLYWPCKKYFLIYYQNFTLFRSAMTNSPRRITRIFRTAGTVPRPAKRQRSQLSPLPPCHLVFCMQQINQWHFRINCRFALSRWCSQLFIQWVGDRLGIRQKWYVGSCCTAPFVFQFSPSLLLFRGKTSVPLINELTTYCPSLLNSLLWWFALVPYCC